jgi:Aminoglycoside-2''-adenylyltransferase
VGDAIGGAFEPDLALWEPWSPAEAASVLEGVDARWYVAAGWALDLFLGDETRDHDDLEIGVSAHEYDAIAERLSSHGLELFVVGGGLAWPPTETARAAHHQTWARDRDTGSWRVDVMREPSDDGSWVFRRDPGIRLPAASVVARTSAGIPYAQPEIVLLFKAKGARPKDESDFVRVLPHLDERRRRWLRDALALVHPGHAWIEVLKEP